MKRKICATVMIILLVMMLPVSCGKKQGNQNNGGSTSEIDVDLTVLSSTMVYSEVYNMMMNPKKYIGKTVKMNGAYAIYEGENRIYHACLIADATACCSQGIEFQLSGSLKYPDDYPEIGSDITVIGTFDTYMEGECEFCQLIDAVIVEDNF